MAQYETVTQIINRVAIECGLSAPAAVFASTDPAIIQMRTLLGSVGRRLLKRYGWLKRIKEYTFTTDGAGIDGQGTYNLPADFVEMVDQTQWNRTTRREMTPASPQQWQLLKARSAATTFTVFLRPRDGTLQIWPAGSSGELVAFEYYSRNWVETSGQTSPDKDAPTADTDTVCLDTELMCAALKYLFRGSKGFDTTMAAEEFKDALESCKRASFQAAPVLSLNGRTYNDKMLDESNAPHAGLGFDGNGGLF